MGKQKRRILRANVSLLEIRCSSPTRTFGCVRGSVEEKTTIVTPVFQQKSSLLLGQNSNGKIPFQSIYTVKVLPRKHPPCLDNTAVPSYSLLGCRAACLEGWCILAVPITVHLIYRKKVSLLQQLSVIKWHSCSGANNSFHQR